MTELCYCGKPLHYTDRNVEREMNKIVKRQGRMVKVTVGDKSWEVDRHFVALHGVRAVDLPKLGFKRVAT